MADNIDNSSNQTQGLFLKSIKWLWRLFSSVKLAIALILIITALSVIGIFTSADLFSSWYFIAAGTLLMLNILICNINRWKGIQKNLKGSRIKQSEDFFKEQDKATASRDLQYDATEVLQAVKATLQKRGYRLRLGKDNDDIYIAVDKNRFFILGTYLSHLSIILLVLAYIIGSTLGFRESAFIVAEGATEELGYDTGLSLELISFTDSYYEDGTPSDYASEVILYKDGVEVARTVIRVNYPLNYGGIRFYQSFFGPAAVIQVTKNGETVFSDNVALYGSFDSYGYYRNVGFIDVEESKLSLAIITPAFNTPDPMIPEGQLAILAYKNGAEVGVHLLEKMTPLEIDDVILSYESDAQYSGFQVKSDPANALVWIACSLFIIGLVMVFYFPHSQMWLLIKSTSPGHSTLLVRVMASKAFNNTAVLNDSISGIENRLKEASGNQREVPHG
jgi:cytochrome c biogenesis protein